MFRRKPCIKNRVDETLEKAVVDFALNKPANGQLRVCNELKKEGILYIFPRGVRAVWLRYNLETFQKRLKALEAKMAQGNMILTEEQLKALEKAKEEKQAQGEIETEHSGYLLSKNTYYIGTIKGVGRIYQKNALIAADILNDSVILPS